MPNSPLLTATPARRSHAAELSWWLDRLDAPQPALQWYRSSSRMPPFWPRPAAAGGGQG